VDLLANEFELLSKLSTSRRDRLRGYDDRVKTYPFSIILIQDAVSGQCAKVKELTGVEPFYAVAPGTCASVPVKSSVTCSPAMRTATRMRTGRATRPSSSQNPSAS